MSTVKSDDLVYDVGMHRGEDTAFYLAKGFRVVGFEADPQLAAACCARFADAVADGRLRIVEGAVCAQPAGTKIAFYRNPDSSIWGTIRADWAERNRRLGAASELIEVAAVDFRVCLQEFGVPHYLKIDIEGADLVCLEALAGVAPRPDYVSFESTRTHFNAIISEFDLLCSLGYRRFAVVQQAWIERRPYEGSTRTGAPLRHVFEPGASGPFGAELGAPYLSSAEAIDAYRPIFERYRRYGEDSPLMQARRGRFLLKTLKGWSILARRRPLVGWYDTHAALSEEGGIAKA